MNRSPAWMAGVATASIAALGCSAVLAQATAEPNPGAVPPSTGVSPNAAEPSAATPGTAGNEDQGHVSRSATQQFIDEAANSNLAEIAAARYAVAHSRSPEVKAFAQKMIHDHTDANDKLIMIAMAHGYGTPLAVDHHDSAALHRLEQNHGRQFNAAYSRAQARDHEQVVSQFRRAEQDPRIAPAVREFARTTLPVIEDHLHMANQLVATEAQGNQSSG